MFSIDLSNGSKLTAGVDFVRRELTITQQPAAGQATPPQVIRLPLTDLKRTAETVTQIVKAFRG